jgi:DNA topoisomerase-1
MDPATLTFEQAMELLQIPRTVGTDPESGEDVVAYNGKFGPYLKKGTDTRSLTAQEQLLSITLEEAQAIFAQPKQRRGRVAAAPLRELGNDPATDLPMVLREGRFGPYVTDGTTNASLRKGDEIESLTVARASELLADRRAAGPSTRKKKAAKKAAPAKKSVKKTAKKSVKKTAKKAGAAKKAAAAESPAMRAAPLEQPF